MNDRDHGGGSWALLTGHGHVLVEIARNPQARIRDISPVADLEAAGYLTRTRTGRRVVYTVNRDSQFRHSAQEGHRVGPLLDLLADTGNGITPNRTTAEAGSPRAAAGVMAARSRLPRAGASGPAHFLSHD